MSHNISMDKFAQSSIKNIKPNVFQTSPKPKDDFEVVFSDNFFKKDFLEDDINASLPQRLNGFDSDILGKKNSKSLFDFKNFEAEIKNARLFLENSKKDSLLKIISPRLYNRRLLKGTLKRINSLNNLLSSLRTKQIPIGEGDGRYKSLINYLSEVNSLQAELNKNIQKY